MMVGGVDEGGRPQANPELLKWLDNVANNYDKAGKLARAVHDIQTGALSREEAASKHGTTLHNIQVTESRLRKRGVPITPRMGGKAPLSQAELRVNEETGKYGLSPRAIQRIVELRQQGYSLREIAKDVGVSSSNVHKYLSRKNMDGRLDEDRNRMPDEPDTMP
jgi:transposase